MQNVLCCENSSSTLFNMFLQYCWILVEPTKKIRRTTHYKKWRAQC